jgi:hypothetical protein
VINITGAAWEFLGPRILLKDSDDCECKRRAIGKLFRSREPPFVLCSELTVAK